MYKYLGWACGAAYILTFEYGVIAARKHYSVDVWLGFLVACFIYITFSNGWVPAFFKGFTL